VEAMGYYLVRGFIGCQWVGVAPCASSVGEEVGHDVLFAFKVLRCEAVVAVEDQCGQVSGYLLDCGVGQRVLVDSSRWEEPSNCRGVVA
jgi:hypothetical protein